MPTNPLHDKTLSHEDWAYTHDLSKRTTAYAGYNQVSSDVTAGEKVGDVKRFAFGVRHSF